MTTYWAVPIRRSAERGSCTGQGIGIEGASQDSRLYGNHYVLGYPDTSDFIRMTPSRAVLPVEELAIAHSGQIQSVRWVVAELFNPKQGCAGNCDRHGDEVNDGNTGQDHDGAAKAQRDAPALA